MYVCNCCCSCRVMTLMIMMIPMAYVSALLSTMPFLSKDVQIKIHYLTFCGNACKCNCFMSNIKSIYSGNIRGDMSLNNNKITLIGDRGVVNCGKINSSILNFGENVTKIISSFLDLKYHSVYLILTINI